VIDGVVRFLGHREGTEVEDLVCASDIVVVPSRGRTSDGPVLCAWSAGRPVVVTEEGPSEGVEDAETGLRARAEPASVADGVRRVLGDWDRARRMGESGRRALRRDRSWEAYSGRVMGVYAATS
jgi:2-deoxystreptamine N-acetyl-D-glucosaminyltransferase/2-deoxystreptamine glucosyltransferase